MKFLKRQVKMSRKTKSLLSRLRDEGLCYAVPICFVLCLLCVFGVAFKNVPAECGYAMSNGLTDLLV